MPNQGVQVLSIERIVDNRSRGRMREAGAGTHRHTPALGVQVAVGSVEIGGVAKVEVGRRLRRLARRQRVAKRPERLEGCVASGALLLPTPVHQARCRL
eukprot:141035-Chlamydomonas_euryale.AAC.14